MFATNYPFLDIFLSSIVLAGLALWIVLFAHVLADLFRSHDLTGAAKALWIVALLVLPLVGTLVYVLARGATTHERQVQLVKAQQLAFEEYIRGVANTKE